MSYSERPKNDIYEKNFLIKLFHNKSLQQTHLDGITPAIFADKTRRLICYLMKRLKAVDKEISVNNMFLFVCNPDEHLLAFQRKNKIEMPTEEMITDILYEVGTDASDAYFDVIYKNLLEMSFYRFVDKAGDEIKLQNTFPKENSISAICGNAKAILTVHKILFDGKEYKRDQLQETLEKVNSKDEYITTSSAHLNSMIGGFTRGYVDAIIGKSGHGKSSWVDFNILHTLMANKAKKIVKITPEEDAATQWRRYLAMICKISTTIMRQKGIIITKDHLDAIKKAVGDRLAIYDKTNRMKDILEIQRVAECDQLYLDHLQKVVYPGTKDPMGNMIGNIPGLVGAQEQLAKQKNMSIINLSQVGDKEIARSQRMSKRPRYHDAFGSSTLYQTAREFLAIYYPIKDKDEEPDNFIGEVGLNTFEVYVEKSSYSIIGKIKMNFDYEFNRFADVGELKKTDFISKKEQELF